MPNDKGKLKLSSTVTIISILIALGFDIFIFAVLSTVVNKDYEAALYTLIILLNVIYFIFIRVIFAKHQKNKVYKMEEITPILDDLTYIDPNFSETFGSDENVLEVNEDLEISDFEDDFEEVEVLKPKEFVYVKGQYDKKISFDKYIDQMYMHFIDNGLEVKKDILRNVFSSIAASRMIYIKHESLKVVERFIELFITYIGANHILLDMDQGVDPSDTLIDLMKDASKDSHKLNFMTFYMVPFETIEAKYVDLVDYAFNSVKVMSLDDLPNNLWFFINSKEHKPTTVLTDVMFTIELSAKVVEPKEIVYENDNKFSYDKLMHVLRDVEEIHYLEETHWKKIDLLEEHINSHLTYRLDNRVIRQLERFSAIFTLSGGEQNECLDSILATKLLYLVNNLNITKKDSEDEGFVDLLDRLFGLENLMLSKDLVKMLEDQFLLKEEVV